MSHFKLSFFVKIFNCVGLTNVILSFFCKEVVSKCLLRLQNKFFFRPSTHTLEKIQSQHWDFSYDVFVGMPVVGHRDVILQCFPTFETHSTLPGLFKYLAAPLCVKEYDNWWHPYHLPNMSRHPGCKQLPQYNRQVKSFSSSVKRFSWLQTSCHAILT